MLQIRSGSSDNALQVNGVDIIKFDANGVIAANGKVIIDNDGTFDLNLSNIFKCTPTSTFVLTINNHKAGTSGYILLDNTGGYTITKDTAVKVGVGFLSAVSNSGIYLISYFDDGVNTYMTTSGSFA